MGKKFGDATKTERISELVHQLNTAGSFSMRWMIGHFRISRKTALRDLDALEALGIGFAQLPLDNGDTRIAVDSSSRRIQVSYTMEQVMALFLGRQMFDFLKSTPFEESFTQVYEQIENRLKKKNDLDNLKKLSRKLYTVHEGPKQFSEQTAGILVDCINALRNDKALVIDYTNFRGEPSQFLFYPYTLATFRRGLYLVGRSDGHEGAIIKLAIERIQSTQLTGVNVDCPEEYTPETFFESALFLDTGPVERVELLFQPGAEAFIGLRRFHPSQEIRKRKDGCLLLSMNVHVGYEVLYWVMSFGARVQVLKPASLIAQVRDEIASALALYPQE